MSALDTDGAPLPVASECGCDEPAPVGRPGVTDALVVMRAAYGQAVGPHSISVG
jgi:hypothetical protein